MKSHECTNILIWFYIQIEGYAEKNKYCFPHAQILVYVLDSSRGNFFLTYFKFYKTDGFQ
ncbi:hypothetical protein DHB64_04960 [Antarcticibacterium sp. W02-3]|nr:hypothetical protein [Antarcticibacterium sp. W02-3]